MRVVRSRPAPQPPPNFLIVCFLSWSCCVFFFFSVLSVVCIGIPLFFVRHCGEKGMVLVFVFVFLVCWSRSVVVCYSYLLFALPCLCCWVFCVCCVFVHITCLVSFVSSFFCSLFVNCPLSSTTNIEKRETGNTPKKKIKKERKKRVLRGRVSGGQKKKKKKKKNWYAHFFVCLATVAGRGRNN